MPSSDYAEVALGNDRPLSASVRESRGFALCASFESMTMENSAADSTVAQSAIKSSALQQWCEEPVAESSGAGKRPDPPPPHFSINGVMLEVVQTLHETDVVCLIAPTGSGKSLLAPYIAEQFALLQNAKGGNARKSKKKKDIMKKGYRKTLLVAPNAEHAGSTARCFDRLFCNSNIRVSAFFNPYVERQARSERGITTTRKLASSDNSPEFVITTYNSAIRVLPHADLNLLILDEVHEANDNVQVTMAMALKMMLASSFDPEKEQVSTRKLNKLLLMTATLDEKERERYKEYFTSHGLSFKVVDFDYLRRRHKLTMSCLCAREDFNIHYTLPKMFELAPLGDQVATDLKARGNRANQSTNLDQNPEHLHNRMRDSLNWAMKLACEDLRGRLVMKQGDVDMQSIIVILPGMDQVDRMYTAAFKLPNFNFDGKPGFHPVRLTSLVKDDELITSESWHRGGWMPVGRVGRIVITTNLVAAGLTVPNAAYVIDSGLQKMLREYTRDGLRSLETTTIDRLMIVQRAGRTGRTTDGEYFLPYSVEKVDEMVKMDHGELLLNRNFEERHLLYKKLYELELLHEPPERLIKELQMSMETRGLYSESGGFPKDVILMNSLLNFLPTESARIVIQGTQLGIAAHAILLVADSLSRVKFCRVGFAGSRNYYGPSDVKSAIHLYCEAMDAKHADRFSHSYLTKIPEMYRGVGDSIALADLLASFFSTTPEQLNRSALNSTKIEPCNFWSGEAGERTLADLYPAFVKDEGRDAVARFVYQIESALRSASLFPPFGIFDPRLNRHIISRDNFCLDEDGRALLAALLTMHSSRAGEQSWKEQEVKYEIYRDLPGKKTRTYLYPESRYTQPKTIWEEKEEQAKTKKGKRREKEEEEETRKMSNMIYGRYTEMFERNGKYSGLIDPITLKQMAFLLNINGDRILHDDLSECSLLLRLNASPGAQGFKIRMDRTTFLDVDEVRIALERGLQMLTNTRNESLIADLEQFIIAVWREGESQMELEEMNFDDPPPPPPPEISEEERLKRHKKLEERKKVMEEEQKKLEERLQEMKENEKKEEQAKAKEERKRERVAKQKEREERRKEREDCRNKKR